MVVNRQNRVRVRVAAIEDFARRASRRLRLGRRRFDVTLVDEAEIARLNLMFRGKNGPADVLSFPWQSEDRSGIPEVAGKLADFIGDVVISAPAARENAAREGHSVQIEIDQLILHGLLHLIGYDHEADCGEMNALELDLRRRLGIEG
ncbi:MAG: rRNA maturation RNase YbeY [Terriglobia bacterium]